MLVSFLFNFRMAIFIELREVLSESRRGDCQVRGPCIPTEVSQGLDLFACKKKKKKKPDGSKQLCYLIL